MKKAVTPRLTLVLTRDWGPFLATFGPPIMGSITFVVYLTEIVSGKISDSTISDIFIFLLMIPLSGLVFMPAVLWWYYVIRRTFQNGKVLEAKVKKVDKKFIVNIGVTYAFFEEDGKEIERIADFVNTKKVRSVLSSPQLTVVVDKKRNVSFIREMFESDSQGRAEV